MSDIALGAMLLDPQRPVSHLSTMECAFVVVASGGRPSRVSSLAIPLLESQFPPRAAELCPLWKGGSLHFPFGTNTGPPQSASTLTCLHRLTYIAAVYSCLPVTVDLPVSLDLLPRLFPTFLTICNVFQPLITERQSLVL